MLSWLAIAKLCKTKYRLSVKITYAHACRAADQPEGVGINRTIIIHVHELVFYTDVPFSLIVSCEGIIYSPLYTKVVSLHSGERMRHFLGHVILQVVFRMRLECGLAEALLIG